MKKFTLEEIQARVVGGQEQLRFAQLVPSQQRAQFDESKFDYEARTATLVVTTDTPILHWFGYLILDHSPPCVDLSRVNTRASLLKDHDWTKKLGGAFNWQTDGKRLRCDVKFSRSRPEAQAELDDIQDGIPSGVSAGFTLQNLTLVEEREGDYNLYKSTAWTMLEPSLVQVEADINAGIGRSKETAEAPPADAEQSQKETCDMGDSADGLCPDCECDPCECDGEEETQSERALASVQIISETRNLKPMENLIKIGEMFGETELARDYALTSDATEEGLKRMIAEKRSKAQSELPTPTPRVDMTAKYAKKYSLARALKLASGIDTKACGFEQEISDELQRSVAESGGEYHGGILVPTGMSRETLQRAGLDTATSGSGQETVFTDYGGFIENLYAKAKVLSLGVTVRAGLRGNLKVTKQTGAASAGWVAENPGSDASESNLSTGSVTLSPKSLIATTSFSRQLLNQSEWNIQSEVERDLAIAMALAVDRAAIHGTGSSNQPLGLYGQSGVNAVAFGGNMSKALLTDMETAIAEANADIGSYAYLTTPGLVGRGAKTLEFSSAGSRPLYLDGKLNGQRCEASTQVSKVMSGSTATGGSQHGMIFGVWSQLYWGEWGAMELLVDQLRLKKQAMIEVTSFLMADIQCRHAEAFTKSTGQTS